MQKTDKVYSFEDPIDFLQTLFQEKRRKNPRFSLRAWARQLGYQNPSFLAQVLKRERRLRMDLALRIAANLKLKGKELRYFELIVMHQASRNSEEKKIYEGLLLKSRPSRYQTFNALNLDIFAAIADWYHWAILSLTKVPDFQADPDWLRERLGPEVDKKTIREALDRLLKLGILVRHPDGRYEQQDLEGSPYLVDNQIPSAAIRQYHSQMIAKAQEAVEKQSMSERQLRGTTLAFRKEDMPLVAEIIAEAHRQVSALAARSGADEVYQFNTQFFRLTKKKPERAH